MECFTVNEMASFLDGMAGKDRGKFIKHLNQCPECFDEYCFLTEVMAENVEDIARLEASFARQ